MLLGIDAGNTNIVAAIINDGSVIKELRYNTGKNKDILYHKEHLKRLIDDYTVSGIIISSVVPEINSYLEDSCLQLLNIPPLFVNAKLKTGLTIKYDNPNKLGADLITAAIGAVNKYGNPVIVIDIGTATTFSVINKDNEYLGGMIAPGPYTSMKALSSMASQLPEAELETVDKAIATNTADCIRVGTMTAHAAMIDGMIERVKHELALSDIKLVATGGFAEKITAMCKHKIICDKNLIFNGLYNLYKMNKQK